MSAQDYINSEWTQEELCRTLEQRDNYIADLKAKVMELEEQHSLALMVHNQMDKKLGELESQIKSLRDGLASIAQKEIKVKTDPEEGRFYYRELCLMMRDICRDLLSKSEVEDGGGKV